MKGAQNYSGSEHEATRIKLALKDFKGAKMLVQEGLSLAEMLGAKEDHLRFTLLLQAMEQVERQQSMR